ncbi:MAG: hypothetical protein ACJAZX_000380 [Rickettsiales bacterium]|jgi:hypothetical protein
MLLSFILIKILVSILAVAGLAIITEKYSPSFSGILSGFPLGSAITLLFYGLEVNADFAAESSSYSFLSLISCQIFIYVYYLSILKIDKFNPKFNPLICTFLATLAFFISSYLFEKIHLSLHMNLAAALISIIIFSYLFRKFPEVKIKNRIKLTMNNILVRSAGTAIIVILITSISQIVGAKWAGLFSGFPVIVLPLILIIHISYKKEHVCAIIKNFPKGLGALIIYLMSVHSFYPLVGIYLGTLISFAFSAVYLVLILFFKARIDRN